MVYFVSERLNTYTLLLKSLSIYKVKRKPTFCITKDFVNKYFLAIILLDIVFTIKAMLDKTIFSETFRNLEILFISIIC